MSIQFTKNVGRLDGFSEADVVRNENRFPWIIEKLEQRLELVRIELCACRGKGTGNSGRGALQPFVCEGEDEVRSTR